MFFINKLISYLFLALALYSAYSAITTDTYNYWGLPLCIISLAIAYREKLAD